MKYTRFTTVVWNNHYTKVFVEGCLPSLLTPGNLPSFNQDGLPIKYRIYTTSNDAEFIRKSPIYKVLENNVELEMDVNLVSKLILNNNDKFHIYNLCFSHAIKDTNSDDGSWIWIHPDDVFSNGSFSTVYKAVQSGKRAIFSMSGLRTYKQSMLPILLSNYQSNDGLISISGRDLVRLSVEYATGKMKKLYWGEYSRTLYHSSVLWNVKNEGILQRAIYGNLIFLYPEKKDEMPLYNGVSIEVTDYITRSVPNKEDLHIVNNTDDYYNCSMENLNIESSTEPSSRISRITHQFIQYFDNYVTCIPSILDTALMYNNFIEHDIREFFMTRHYYFYGNNIRTNSKQWKKIKDQSDNFANCVFTLMDIFDKYPRIMNLARKFRVLELRTYKIKPKIIRFLCVRIFPLIELIIFKPIVRLMSRTENLKPLGE